MNIARRAIAAGALAGALGGGCAPRAEPPRAPSPEAEAAAQRLAQLLNADNGLMVRTWSVTGDAQRIGAALAARQEGPVLPPEQTEALRRGGLRLVRLRAEDVEPLLGTLGATPVDVAAWFGQLLQWRELLARPIVEDTVVAGPGGLRRLAPGKLQLMARSWTVATEQGVLLYLELLPRHSRPVPELSVLLGERRDQGEPFDDLAAEFFIEPGQACVLTWEEPGARWPGGPAGEEAPAARPPGGPAVQTPPTVGEYLLWSPPRRTMLVFVPSIPARLLEAYRVTNAAAH